MTFIEAAKTIIEKYVSRCMGW